jgi:hypothetical protein
LGRPCFLMTGLFLIFVFCATPTVADTNESFSIDPIGDHASGEKFNITGTTTLHDCKKVGIEIFPKEYWDSAVDYARSGSDGRIVFMDIASTKENFHPTGIKLVRYMPDGTQSYEELEKSPDHWTSVVQVEKSASGEKQWNFQVEKSENGTPFSPGSYHVNIWDATAQVQKHDNTLANGWDIINQKIYPSTARINIWDKNNQKDMYYTEFTIKG